MLNVT